MNAVWLTGYLNSDATSAWTACAPDRPSRRKLIFDVIVGGGQDGIEFPQRCYIDDSPMLTGVEKLLVAGRAVIVTGKLTAKALYTREVLIGYAPEVRVESIEIPNRSAALPEPEQAFVAAAHT